MLIWGSERRLSEADQRLHGEVKGWSNEEILIEGIVEWTVDSSQFLPKGSKVRGPEQPARK